MKIERLELRGTTEKALKSAGCTDVMWFRTNWDKVDKIPGIGKSALAEIVTQLAGVIVGELD